jgi:D-sedoheptulose 7-phosphate isomerase
MQKYILEEFEKTRSLFETILGDQAFLKTIEVAAQKGIQTLKEGKKIMLCGNGGSAADAQHLAAELVSKLCYDRPGLNAIALTTDTSALTAIGNDYGYDRSFARQVEAIGQAGDMLIGISTSGRSKNVLEAIKSAQAKGIYTVGFLGQEGRDIGALVDLQINIPSNETPKIQEGHIATGHIICSLIEEEIFGAEYNPKRKTA